MSDNQQNEEMANMVLVALIAVCLFVYGMLYAGLIGVIVTK